jgi:ABC-type molybdenum transport system ATPase subunit/photorepair protein PhrA
VEQMKPEVEIDQPSTRTSAQDEMNIAESTDNAEENVKDNVIQFQEVKCRISGKDILKELH